jgi:glycosyltransferase involved in cell wall biosynthesis
VSRTQRPSVSVVIPAFAAEDTIRLTIASAVSQDPKPPEVIVVDDCSPDGTAAVVRELTELDSSVRLVHRDENGGPAAARRTGIHAASGELIALLDADDIWLPGKLSRQVSALEDPRLDAVQGGGVNVDEELNPLRHLAARVDQNQFEDFLCWRNLPRISSTLVARREVMTDDLFWDDLPAIEDWAMVLALSSRHRIGAIPDPLVLCRVRSTSRSHSLDAQVEAGRRVLARFADTGVGGRVRRRAYAAFYVMLCGGALQLGQRSEAAHWAMRAILRDPRSLGRIMGVSNRRARDRRRLARSGLSRTKIELGVKEQLATLGTS